MLSSAATKSIIEGAKQLDPVIKSLALAFQGTAEETAVYAQSLGSVYEAIKVNAVDRAAADIEAVAKASNSLYDAYFDQVDIITDLVRTFDGSATAAANLNASLLAGKEAAYALAAGIASIGGQVSKTLLDSADQIRNSVLTQEEREAALRYKGKFLEAILPAVTNPDDILTIANELERSSPRSTTPMKTPPRRTLNWRQARLSGSRRPPACSWKSRWRMSGRPKRPRTSGRRHCLMRRHGKTRRRHGSSWSLPTYSERIWRISATTLSA